MPPRCRGRARGRASHNGRTGHNGRAEESEAEHSHHEDDEVSRSGNSDGRQGPNMTLTK
jgi:hypothetical protein